MRSAVLLLVVLAAIAPPAAAQHVVIAPAAPNASSFIVATTNIQAVCLEAAQVTITGRVIRAVHPQADSCGVIIGTPVLVASRVVIGYLTPGDYRYELYESYSDHEPVLRATTTFTVAADPPPADVLLTDSYGLAFLSALFVLVGAIAVGRIA